MTNTRFRTLPKVVHGPGRERAKNMIEHCKLMPKINNLTIFFTLLVFCTVSLIWLPSVVGPGHSADTYPKREVCYNRDGTIVNCFWGSVGAPVHGRSNYRINGVFPNQTTTDNRAGLMWAADGACAGCNNGNQLTWEGALSFCRELNFGGHADWRLPTQKEISNCWGSVTLAKYFPNSTNNTYYWTSTIINPDDPSVRIVYFPTGYSDNGLKDNYYSVRCVRTIQ